MAQTLTCPFFPHIILCVLLKLFKKMGELWKQCGAWLVRMNVLPPNHRICWPDATVQDLAYALRYMDLLNGHHGSRPDLRTQV
jgi:hypothetical protein